MKHDEPTGKPENEVQSDEAEPSTGLRSLLSTPKETFLSDPRKGVSALVDWSRGWGATAFITTRRALGTAPSTDIFDEDKTQNAPIAVLLPGVWETWEVLTHWGRALHALGWNVQFVPELDKQLGTLEDLGNRLGGFLARNDLENVLILAHSKGGLVTKQAMTTNNGWRIRKLIACGTPFDGAPLAELTVPALQMRSLTPWSEEIKTLRANHEVNDRIIAIQAQWDQNVPADPDLPGAKVITVPVEGHNALLTAPEVIALVSHFAGAKWDHADSADNATI